MAIGTWVSDLEGEWTGINRLWLTPNDPARESETNARVGLAAGGAFVAFRYTWADRGEPQDGVFLLRISTEPGDLAMVWIDSWHTGGKFMEFEHEGAREGRLSVRGSYSAPPGPDWGWRIVLCSESQEGLRILMYNIAPDGDEALAVDTRYHRSNAP